MKTMRCVGMEVNKETKLVIQYGVKYILDKKAKNKGCGYDPDEVDEA